MLNPLHRAGGRHPISNVRMHIGRNQAGTLHGRLGLAAAARVVTRRPCGDTGRTGGMTPFLFNEFPRSLAPRWGRTNAIVPCYPHNSGIDMRMLLIRLPQM